MELSVVCKEERVWKILMRLSIDVSVPSSRLTSPFLQNGKTFLPITS